MATVLSNYLQIAIYQYLNKSQLTLEQADTHFHCYIRELFQLHKKLNASNIPHNTEWE